MTTFDSPKQDNAMTHNPTTNDAQALDPELLKILVCPVTRSPLRQEGDELVGQTGGLRYPIKDGIPILLADEAKLPQGVSSLDEFKQRFQPPANEL